MKEVYRKYLNNELKLEKWQKIGIICLIISITGTFGWIYEFIFYYFNSGMKTFYYRGANFLPWINIYATGSIMILLLCKNHKKNPFFIFTVSLISTGILEYISGYGMLKLANMRCWNYNTEILNFGNINGFVCLRSVTFFAFSSLILMYLIVPFCIYLSQKINKKTFLIISIGICSIILFDEFYNLIFAKILNLPRATQIYKQLGFKYMSCFKY